MVYFDLTVYLTTALTITVVLDPAGNLPIFLSLTKNLNRKEKQRTAAQATLVGLGLLLSFAIFGNYIFRFLHISVEALQASGGIILLLVSLQLLTGKEEDPGEGGQGVNPAVVPLGTPLLAGPGAIVAVMLAIDNSEGKINRLLPVFAAVFTALFVQWLTFYFGSKIATILGKGGISFLTRVAGMLIAAIAVEILAGGVLGFVSQAITKSYHL